MTAIKYYGGIIRGTAAERTSYVTTNLNAGWLFIESDTFQIYYWTGTEWVLIQGASAAPPASVYDDFPTTYDITTDDTLSPNGKWRCEYRGNIPSIYNVLGPGDTPTNMGATINPRYGIQAQAASVLVGQSISSFTPRLKKSGAPSGNITCTVRRASDDAIMLQFTEAIAATSLTTVFADYTFTAPSPYTLAANDRILVEYGGPNNTVQIDLWSTDHFDGANTRRTRFVGGAYSEGNTADIVAKVALADSGKVGVRVPSSPTNGFPRVFYEYPYANTYGGTGTSASSVVTESSPFTDFDMTMYARTVDQRKSSPNSWETAWIFFRYTDQYHHYALVLKSNGNLQLSKKDNAISDDAQEVFYNTEPTFSYTVNQWNKVRILAVGNHIQVWIDDVAMLDVTDDAAHASEWDYGAAPDTPTDPTVAMYSGLIGLYNEDAEVEFGPMTIGSPSGGGTPSGNAVYTYSNQGATGFPIILTKSANDLPFKSISPASEKIQIIDQILTKSLAIDVIETQLDKDNMRGGAMFRDVATQDIVNTVTETPIFSAVIPGGKMGVNKTIRLTLTGDYLCNSGSARSVTLKVKYGSTTLYDDATVAFGTSASRRSVRLVAELTNKGESNVQQLGGSFTVSDAGGTTSGLGDIGDENVGSYSNLGGSATEDSLVDKIFQVTVTHSAAEANVSIKKLVALLELI